MRVDRLFAFSGALIGSAVALSSIKEEAPERMYETQSFSLSKAYSLQKGLKEGRELRLIFKQENSALIDAFKRKFVAAANDHKGYKDWVFSETPIEEWRDGQLHLVYTRQSRRVES